MSSRDFAARCVGLVILRPQRLAESTEKNGKTRLPDCPVLPGNVTLPDAAPAGSCDDPATSLQPFIFSACLLENCGPMHTFRGAVGRHRLRAPGIVSARHPQFLPGGENGLSHSFRWRELRRWGRRCRLPARAEVGPLLAEDRAKASTACPTCGLTANSPTSGVLKLPRSIKADGNWRWISVVNRGNPRRHRENQKKKF